MDIPVGCFQTFPLADLTAPGKSVYCCHYFQYYRALLVGSWYLGSGINCVNLAQSKEILGIEIIPPNIAPALPPEGLKYFLWVVNILLSIISTSTINFSILHPLSEQKQQTLGVNGGEVSCVPVNK